MDILKQKIIIFSIILIILVIVGITCFPMIVRYNRINKTQVFFKENKNSFAKIAVTYPQLKSIVHIQKGFDGRYSVMFFRKIQEDTNVVYEQITNPYLDLSPDSVNKLIEEKEGISNIITKFCLDTFVVSASAYDDRIELKVQDIFYDIAYYRNQNLSKDKPDFALLDRNWVIEPQFIRHQIGY